MLPGQIEQQGSNLVIYSIDVFRDEGMYQCAATNQHGTTFSTGQLKVLCKHFDYIFNCNFKKNTQKDLNSIKDNLGPGSLECKAV